MGPMETAAKLVAKDSALVKGFRTELELLTRHVRMLEFVEKHGPIGIIRLSSLLGVPRHKVRYSLRILEKEGYIRPTAQGADKTEKTHMFLEQTRGLLTDVVKEIDGLLATLPK